MERYDYDVESKLFNNNARNVTIRVYVDSELSQLLYIDVETRY